MHTKPYKGLAMEGRIAAWYAASVIKDRESYRAMARSVTAGLAPGSAVLEVASGPGFLAIEMAKAGPFRVTGLDISDTFVQMARDNAAREGLAITYRHGNASELPFADNTFDRAACRSAFKNFTEPVKALQEMRRVLKPGGIAVIGDLRRDASPREIDDCVKAMRLSALGTLLTRWTFRTMLIPRAYTRQQFEDLIAQSGFEKAEIRENGIGFEIRLEK